MTREEMDFIGAMNMCDEISNEAYKKIMCHCEKTEPCKILQNITRECWYCGVNMGGEYHGVWVRFRDIEKIVDKYLSELEGKK